MIAFVFGVGSFRPNDLDGSTRLTDTDAECLLFCVSEPNQSNINIVHSIAGPAWTNSPMKWIGRTNFNSNLNGNKQK